jgi:hypothetical protein
VGRVAAPRVKVLLLVIQSCAARRSRTRPVRCDTDFLIAGTSLTQFKWNSVSGWRLPDYYTLGLGEVVGEGVIARGE